MTIQEIINKSKNAIMPNIKMNNKKYLNEDFSYTIRDMMNGTIKIRYYGGKVRGWMWFPFLLKHCIKCSKPLFMAYHSKPTDSICDELKCRESDTDWYLDNCPTSHYYGYIVKILYEEKRSGKYKGNLHRTKICQHRWVMEQVVGKEALIGMHVHHIDMKKLNNNISNLWLCTPTQHMSAHHSFNDCCEELMGNFHKYCDIKFNIETGRYYLINQQ